MARDFSKSTSNYALLGAGDVNNIISGAAAISIHCWAQADSFNTANLNNRLLNAVVGAAGTGIMFSVHNGVSAVLVGGGRARDADSFQQVNGTTVLATGTWYSLGLVFNYGASTLQPYVNGVAEGSPSVTFGAATYTAGSPALADSIGGPAGVPSVTAPQWDGAIAEFALWTRALSAAEFAALAQRAPAARFRPARYWPMLGSEGAAIRELARGGPHLSVTGTIGNRAHAPVAAPFGADQPPPAWAAAGVPIPVFMDTYRRRRTA